MELENITEPSAGKDGARTGKRRYDDACAAAHAMDVIGERWALLVARELMFGPKRFSDLRASLPGLSANVLTQRLEGLEASGVLRRRRLPPPAAVQVYELTEWGYALEPVFQALGRWAARSPAHDPSRPIGAASLLLSFGTMLDPARARGLTARIGFEFGEERFIGDLAHGRLAIARAAEGEGAPADITFAGGPGALAAAVYGGEPLAALEAAGELRVLGERALAERFFGLFSLPPPAG